MDLTITINSPELAIYAIIITAAIVVVTIIWAKIKLF